MKLRPTVCEARHHCGDAANRIAPEFKALLDALWPDRPESYTFEEVLEKAKERAKQ